jgi:hypothetical protein
LRAVLVGHAVDVCIWLDEHVRKAQVYAQKHQRMSPCGKNGEPTHLRDSTLGHAGFRSYRRA